MDMETLKVKAFERAWGVAYEFISKDNEFTVSTELIPAGKILAKHYHKVTREIEIILDGNPLVNGRESKRGEIYVWESGMIHEHDNRHGNTDALVLTVSFPSFTIEDEIFV